MAEPIDDIAYIGIGEFWEGEQPFGLCPADRDQHAYCIGKTGTGKSTLLRNLILRTVTLAAAAAAYLSLAPTCWDDEWASQVHQPAKFKPTQDGLEREESTDSVRPSTLSGEKAIDQGGEFDEGEGAVVPFARVSRLFFQSTDRLNRVDLTGTTPSDELDRVDPALTRLDLPGVAVGFVQLCGE